MTKEMPKSKKQISLSKTEASYLAKISTIVLNSANPSETLAELEQQLTKKQRRSITVLKRALAGELHNTNTSSQWYLLNSLAKHGKKDNLDYIGQFLMLADSQSNLRKITKHKSSRAIYLALLVIMYSIVFTIYKIKVLPVFADYMSNLNQQLPQFTVFFLEDAGSIILLTVFLFFFLQGLSLIFLKNLYAAVRNYQNT